MAGWMHSNGVDIPRAEQDAIQTIMADYLASHRTAMKADFAAALNAIRAELIEDRWKGLQLFRLPAGSWGRRDTKS